MEVAAIARRFVADTIGYGYISVSTVASYVRQLSMFYDVRVGSGPVARLRTYSVVDDVVSS